LAIQYLDYKSGITNVLESILLSRNDHVMNT